jgi:hypothetical protein
MGTVVYMKKSNGLWERWQIYPNGQPAPVRTPGMAQPGGKKIRATNLASCLSLSVISQTAAITVHFPGYLCSKIPGYTGPSPQPAPGTNYQKEYDQIKAKLLEMVTTYRGEFGKVEVHAAQGAHGVLSRADLFIQDVFRGTSLTLNTNNIITDNYGDMVPRETVVDLDATPPTYTYGRTTRTIPP